MRDITFALRSFRKNPGFALTVVLTIALSIGATTTMFSIVKGVLIDPLPFANGDRLVWTMNRGTRPIDAMSPPDLKDWARLVPSFEAVGSWAPSNATIRDGSAQAHVLIAEVTDNWFAMLGVKPQLGRGFAPGEEGPGKPKIAVISDALWHSMFGADPGIVGRAVLLDGNRYEVVGVAPRAFDYPSHIDLWRPLALPPDHQARRGGRLFWGPIALLKRGATFQQAQREARVAAAQLRAQYPLDEAGLSFDIQPLHDHLVGDTSTPLMILLAAVGTLLLIACVNVAALFLVRASGRSAELGIRLALGAGRRRLAAQMLVESLLLTTVGGVLGVAAAAAGVHALVVANVGGLPLLANVAVDPGVTVFAVVVTAAASVVFAMMPSVQVGRTNVVDALRSGSRSSSSSRRTVGARSTLVAAEVALVVPLLIGASLLASSFSRLVTADPGFRSDHLVRFDMTLPLCGTPRSPDTTCANVNGTHYNRASEQRQFLNEVLAQLRAEPQMQMVSAGFGAPFTDWAVQQATIDIQGRQPTGGATNPVEMKIVKAGYFATLGARIIEGRDFTPSDFRGRDYCARVAIVSESAVKAYFGDLSPIGAQLTGLCDSTTTVIGVATDMKTRSLTDTPEPALYLSADETPMYLQTVFVRSTADPRTVMTAARRAVASVDKTIPVYHMETMEDAVANVAAPARLAARIVSGFAIAALLLSLIGIYGLIAGVVRDRRRELGIRIALGARAAHVVGLAVRSGLIAVVCGTVVGVALAGAGSRVLRGLLYGVSPTDVSIYMVTCVALLVVTVVAAWIPGRRAASVDPLIAMRPE